VVRLFAVHAAAVVALAAPFHSSVAPLSPKVKHELRQRGFWHQGCPVGLGDLRMLTVSHRDRHQHVRTGELIVNRTATAPLRKVFRRLYRLHFPIRHMRYDDFYGPKAGRPADGDVTASFECRQAVPSPCTGGKGTGTWSNHAYGLAVDVNPLENPYVGCGQSRDPRTKKYFDRSRHLPLMVTRNTVAAFASVGWGWGGSWTGNTKDYMHFSHNGH
jgi:hypothetical protein